MGAALETWDWVWPAIAEGTQVALYDRALSEQVLRQLVARTRNSPPYRPAGALPHSGG